MDKISFNKHENFPLIAGLNENSGLFFKCEQQQRSHNSKDQMLNSNINCTFRLLAGRDPGVAWLLQQYTKNVLQDCLQSLFFSEELNAQAAALLYNYQLCCNTLLTSLLMKHNRFPVAVPIIVFLKFIYLFISSRNFVFKKERKESERKRKQKWGKGRKKGENQKEGTDRGSEGGKKKRREKRRKGGREKGER